MDPKSAKDVFNIFGEGRNPPPNITMANQCVINFVRENPDCKDNPGKKRGGPLNLNRYVNRTYANMSAARMEDDCLWDQELFINRFKQLRGWSQEYSQKMFQSLLNDPAVYRDNLGINGSERVAVPSSWTGEDKQRRKRELGEERVLERSAKTTRIADQDIGKVVSELDAGGFHFMDTSSLRSSSSSWTAPLPSSAITNMDTDGAATAVQIVGQVARKLSAGTERGSETTEQREVPASAETAAESSPKPEEKSGAAGKFDIQRLKTSRQLEATLATTERKLEDSLRSAWLAVLGSEASADEDLLSLLKERALIAVHCVGSLPVGFQPEGSEVSSVKLMRLEYDEEDSPYSHSLGKAR